MCCQGQLWAVAGIQEEDTSVHVTENTTFLHVVVSGNTGQVPHLKVTRSISTRPLVAGSKPVL